MDPNPKCGDHISGKYGRNLAVLVQGYIHDEIQPDLRRKLLAFEPEFILNAPGTLVCTTQMIMKITDRFKPSQARDQRFGAARKPGSWMRV